MAVDEQIQKILDQFMEYGVPPLENLSPQAARETYLVSDAAEDVVATHVGNRMVTLMMPMPEPMARITHVTIGSGAEELMVRVYYPKGDGPFPALVYFHGGGFVVANLNSYDASCRALSNAVPCAVLSVGYRQAPEHKFPTAVEDAVRAITFVQENAVQLNLDEHRIAIGGESAGGNLAAVTCIILRDRGMVLPAHQLLIYPVVDMSGESPSYRQYATAKPLNAPMMRWFKKHYLRGPDDALDPLASPLLSPSLSRLPPATVIAAENDPLRDEGKRYAERLAEEGTSVNYQLYPGSVHEFFGMAGLVGIAKDAVKQAAEDLQKSFAPVGANA